jgi:hypothetical protein
MSAIQESKLNIKPATIVRERGLWKLAVEGQYQADKVGGENEAPLYATDILFVPANADSWYY